MNGENQFRQSNGKSTNSQIESQQTIINYFMLQIQSDITLIIAKLKLPAYKEDQIAFTANIINEFTEYTIHNASQSNSSEDIGTYVINGRKQLVELNHYYQGEGLNEYFIRFQVSDPNLLNKKLKNAYQINNIMSQMLAMEDNCSNYSEKLYYGTIRKLEKAGLSTQVF